MADIYGIVIYVDCSTRIINFKDNMHFFDNTPELYPHPKRDTSVTVWMDSIAYIKDPRRNRKAEKITEKLGYEISYLELKGLFPVRRTVFGNVLILGQKGGGLTHDQIDEIYDLTVEIGMDDIDNDLFA
jgi:hypothetical protein